MAKRNFNVLAKRTLAVVVTVAMLMSCGITGLFSAEAAETGIQASAAKNPGDATKLIIRDEYGNELSNVSEETPVVYVDNSSRASNYGEAKTDAYLTVELRNETEPLTDVLIHGGGTDIGKCYGLDVSLIEETEHTKKYSLHFTGYYKTYLDTTDPYTGQSVVRTVEKSYTPGQCSLTILSKSGYVSDTINVITLEPASDISIKRNGKDIDLNADNMYNTAGGYIVVANHKYKFDGSIITEHPRVNSEYLDKIQWDVYDGILEGDKVTPADLEKMQPASLAEITQDGLLSPKDSGQVTIVATLKDTVKAQRDYERRLKAYNDKYPDPTAAGVPAAPQYVRDRFPEVIGPKSRTVYLPMIDKNTKKIVVENGHIVYQADSNGVRLTKTFNFDFKGKREEYYINSDKVVYSELILDNDGEPIYVDNFNMPKFIPIYIRKDNPATAITFAKTPENDTMLMGETFQLELEKTPTYNVHLPGYEAGATDEIEWKTSNKDVATIDENGVVTAVGKGDVTITAKGDNITATYTLKVRAKATNMYFSPRSLTTRVGISEELSAYLEPVEANEQVYWKSADETVAIVEPAEPDGDYTALQKAKVTGVSVGVTTVTAYIPNSKDPEHPISVNCVVEVKQKNLSKNVELSHAVDNKVEFIKDNQVVDLFTTQDLTINAALKSEGGQTADDKVKWEILPVDSNEVTSDYVSVQEETTDKLVLRGVSKGAVKVIASAEHDDTVNKVFQVNVLRKCDKAVITNYGETKSCGNKYLNVGDSIDLGAYMTINETIANAHDDYIKSFTSSNPNAVELEPITNDIGEVLGCTATAKKIGASTITVTTGSGKTGTITINAFVASSVDITGTGVVYDRVNEKITRTVTLSKDLTGTFKMGYKVYDQDIKDVTSGAAVEWTSSDESVAIVANDGTVVARDVGVTDLTITSGSKSRTCELTVNAPMNAVQFESIAPISFTPRLSMFIPEDLYFRTAKHLLYEGTDYKIEYKNHRTIGTATITLTGMGHYVGTATTTYKIVAKNLNDNDVYIQYPARVECTGAALTPEVSVFYDGFELTPGTDYSLTFSNNKLPGTATLRVSGKGSYTGTVEKTFEIYCDHKNLVNATVVKRPTYEEDGLEEGTCAACGEKNVHNIIPKFIHTENPAVFVEFEKEEYGLNPDETLTPELITRTNNPSMAATDAFRFVTGDSKIATVSETGEIKGIKEGKTTVTVYGENENVEAFCTIVVLNKIKDLTVDPDPIETRVGVSVPVEAVIDSLKTTDEIIWSSSNPDVASVVPAANPLSAIVTGNEIGQAIITAKARYSDISYDVDVNVGARVPSDIIAISTKLDDEAVFIPNSTETTEYTHRIFSSQDVTFTATVTNISGKPSDDTVVWMVSDNDDDAITLPDNDISKEIVADELVVHAASLGTATITAYPQNNPELKTHFKVEVAKNCDKITILDELGASVSAQKNLNVGDGVQLSALLETFDPNHPLNHGDGVRSWSSGDPEVATIDNTGFLTAKKNGDTFIHLKTLSGQEHSFHLTVFTTSNIYFTNVTPPAYDGAPSTMKIMMSNKLEGSKDIKYEIRNQDNSKTPAYAKWESSQPEVASVDEKGLVTAHKPGVTVITGTSGSKSEVCEVTVNAPVSALKIEGLEDMIYTPTKTVYEPDLRVYANDYLLTENVDYTLTYSKNEFCGTANVVITGIGYYTNSASKTFKIVKRSLNSDGVVFSSIPDQKYTGSAITPKVTVKCDGVDVDVDSTFTVKYENNKEAGTAKVTLTPKSTAPYTESRSVEFKIVNTNRGIIGDVDGDGTVTSSDALKILRISLDLEKAEDMSITDVDNDGKVTSGDALQVLRYSIGMDAGNVGKKL